MKFSAQDRKDLFRFCVGVFKRQSIYLVQRFSSRASSLLQVALSPWNIKQKASSRKRSNTLVSFQSALMASLVRFSLNKNLFTFGENGAQGS